MTTMNDRFLHRRATAAKPVPRVCRASMTELSRPIPSSPDANRRCLMERLGASNFDHAVSPFGYKYVKKTVTDPAGVKESIHVAGAAL